MSSLLSTGNCACQRNLQFTWLKHSAYLIIPRAGDRTDRPTATGTSGPVRRQPLSGPASCVVIGRGFVQFRLPPPRRRWFRSRENDDTLAAQLCDLWT